MNITYSKTILFLLFFTFTYSVRFKAKCVEAIKIFKNYECIDKEAFGSGASAITFLVKNEDEQNFIFKMQDGNGRKLIDNKETYYLLKLKNLPGIVKIIEFKADNDYIYEILEFGSKGNLKYFLQESEFLKNNNNLLNFMLILSRTIKAMHNQGVIHTDIKPLNIVINNNNKPILIDFDLAVDNNTEHSGRGTPKYMSPNVLYDWDYLTLYDEKNDVYSLGVTLYFILFGKTPFRGSDLLKLQEAITNGVIDIPVGTPLVFAKILEGCLQKKNEDRFGIKTVIRLLEGAVKNDQANFLITEFQVIKNKRFVLTKRKKKKIDWERALLMFCVVGLVLAFCVFILFYLNRKIEKNTVEISNIEDFDKYVLKN